MQDKKKILFIIAHFEFSNGIASTLKTLIESIDHNKYEIHVLTLYRLDKKFIKPIEGQFISHKGFGFYFKGFSRIVRWIPNKWLYNIFVKEKYNLEIAYQFFGTTTDMLSASSNQNKLSWLHIINPNSDKEIEKKTNCFSRIITVSDSVKDRLESLGISNTTCCYNILNEDSIIKASKENIGLQQKKEFLIVTVARISPEKAFIRQLRCIERILEVTNNFEFWIIGDGPDLPQVKEYVKTHNLCEYVRILGRQNNPFKYVALADLYFCGSLREGFSTACQEAAILGIPVITTEVDGARELIELAGCGRVIPNEEDAITSALCDILTDDDLIASWKDVAKINSRRFYKRPRIAKIERILDEYIN